MIRRIDATTITRVAHISNLLRQNNITTISSINTIISSSNSKRRNSNNKLHIRATVKDSSAIETKVQILVMLITMLLIDLVVMITTTTAIITTNIITIITTIVTIIETTTTITKDLTVEINKRTTSLVTEVDIGVVVIIIEVEAIDNIIATIINNNKDDTIKLRLLKIIAQAKKAVK